MEERHGSDWAQYIHRPFQYRCPLGHDTTMAFSTEENLIHHLVSAHSEAFQGSELRDIAGRSKVAIPSLEAICVLCNQNVSIIPDGTESKGTAAGEGESGQEKLEPSEEKHTTGSEATTEAPKPPPAIVGNPTEPEGPRARVGFVLPPNHRAPDSTATTAKHTSCSGEDIDREDLGSVRVKLHNHLADHLRSVAFLSLRWWDEEGNSGSQGSNEVRVRGDVNSNSSQDLGDSESEATWTSDPKLLQDCLRSLAFPEMYDQFNTIATAANGTCQWLFLHETYKRWAFSDRGLLCIIGTPGSGKSTLLRYALNHISEAPNIDNQALVLSFFFHGRGTELQKTELGLFRSLLHQLLCEVPNALLDLANTFEKKRKEIGHPGDEGHWHPLELKDFFETSLPEISESRSLWLFVDALDESGIDGALRLFRTFKSLTQTPVRFHVCFTCCHWPNLKMPCDFQIYIEHENRQDISAYVQEQLPAGILSTIPALITARAQGNFIWTILVVNRILRLERNGQAQNKIAEEINASARELDALYFELIQSMTDPRSLKLIQWICFALRPLSLQELRWAMIMDHDCSHISLQQCEAAADFPSDTLILRGKLQVLSNGLVEAVQLPNTQAQVVQFIHQSVYDFFFKEGLSAVYRHIGPTEAETGKVDFVDGMAHYQLSMTCIRYLATEQITLSTARGRADLISTFPLLHYATTFWVAHAKRSEIGIHSQDNLLDYFAWPSEHLVELWVRIYRVLEPDSTDCPSIGTSMIHIVSRYHLVGLLRAVLRKADWGKVDINGRDEDGRAPIWWAAENGHEAVVRLLLATEGVDVNSKDDSGHTPLSRAATNGHEATVKLLLDTGRVDPDAKDKDERTPLSWAAENGHTAIVKLLLDTGRVEPDAKDKHERMPLSWAAENGHHSIVELLSSTVSAKISSLGPIIVMQPESSSPKTYDDYTVAVVCAMVFEMSAVRHMLDNEHPRLPANPGDPNIYLLGEICGHNVVLACLPDQQAEGAAATVAMNMARTFPSIKWRFLVGIGGGVPSDKHDIRLGDVVVSMPERQHGGVVLYDLGKATDAGFQLKGFLRPPPPLLRSAVAMMRSDHFVRDSKITEYLSAMTKKSPRLAMYERPSESDVLFREDYRHLSGAASCVDCDRSQTIDRLPRQLQGPVIHYGLIASGDRVLKSSIKGGEIVQGLGDVLCFEMEAAGIEAEFSCIVIRGISDYADSHKNDTWHRYAAAAAAACAKELLFILGPETPSLSMTRPLPPGRRLPSDADILRGQDVPEENITWRAGPERMLSYQGFSEAAPALAKFGADLVAVWRGRNELFIFENNRLYWSRFRREGDGTPRRGEINHVHESAHSQERPAVAALAGKLVASWKGVNHCALYFSTLHPGSLTWSNPVTIPGAGSSTGPALAPWEMNGLTRVYAVWKGIDGDENAYLAWYDGERWEAPIHMPFIETDANVSLTCRGGEIFVSWKDSKTESIKWMRLDKNGNEILKEPQELGKNVKSNLGPALAEVSGTIYAAWKGKGESADVWFTSWPDKGNRFGLAQLVPNSNTDRAPSLTGWENWLVLAWKGVDFEKSMWWKYGRMS